MKQLLFLLFAVSIFTHKIFAQAKSCEVVPEAIKGIYTGDCADGKANGKGKSVGWALLCRIL
jgi:hypothetical protein